jgi:beta-mannosidase
VTTGLPRTLDEYIAYTQVVQAEGIAFGLAHFRRRQPHTSGALIWQFNDVWPGMSWSLVDFDGIPKAAYFSAKRTCAPVAVSLTHDEGKVDVWLVNNSRRTVELPIEVEYGRFNGTGRVTTTVVGAARSAESVRVCSLEAIADPGCYAWASSPTGAFPAARLHFAEIKDLLLGSSSLEVAPAADSVRIKSHGYSHTVRIEQPIPGMRLSDNCFDLRDGEERVILVRGADPTALHISCLSVPPSCIKRGTHR